jgi:hypothetical protein
VLTLGCPTSRAKRLLRRRETWREAVLLSYRMEGKRLRLSFEKTSQNAGCRRTLNAKDKLRNSSTLRFCFLFSASAELCVQESLLSPLRFWRFDFERKKQREKQEGNEMELHQTSSAPPALSAHDHACRETRNQRTKRKNSCDKQHCGRDTTAVRTLLEQNTKHQAAPCLRSIRCSTVTAAGIQLFLLTLDISPQNQNIV